MPWTAAIFKVTRVYHSPYWNEPVSLASNDPSVQESFSMLAVIRWGSHTGKVQPQVFGITGDCWWPVECWQPRCAPEGQRPAMAPVPRGSLHCAAKTTANRGVFPLPCRQGAAPHHLPFPHSVLGDWKVSVEQKGNMFFAYLKEVKILSCQRERKGRRVVGCRKGWEGTMWNFRW